MTLATLIAFARAQAQTDSNGLTDANGIIFANEALEDFHRRLVNGGVDASQLTEATRNCTAGTGTYAYPSDMLFLKAIEMNYANTTADQYVTAQQVDVSNLPGNQSIGWLRTNASTQFPCFDDRGDTYEIFPTPTSAHNLTTLIRLFYFKKPTQYIATSDTVAYPESLDQAILGWRIAASCLYSLGDPSRLIQGDKFTQKYEERVQQYIATLSRGIQSPIQSTPIQLDGFEF